MLHRGTVVGSAVVAITGGTINGTAIGGTTPAAGAFTTLSATGDGTFTSADTSVSIISTGAGQTAALTIKGGSGGGDQYNYIQSLSSADVQYWYLGGDGVANQLTVKTGGSARAVFSSTGVAVTGAISATGAVTFPAGTVALPSITTSGDTNTGIYFPAADTIGFAEGGAEAMRINSSGIVLVGTTTASGTNLLQVNSDIKIGLITAGFGNVGGNSNTAFGREALNGNTDNSNSAFGQYALRVSSTGNSNTAVGNNSLVSNLTGSGNTSVGNNSLVSNSAGSSNSAFGATALNLTTGSSNVGLGFSAGSAITTGTGNVVIGGYTGSTAPISTTGSNSIVISDGSANVRQYYDGTNSAWVFNTGASERMRIDSAGSVGIGGSSFGGGAKVMFIANATTVPTTNPVGGGVMYVEAGALKYRGSSGTVTTIAAA